MAKKQSKIEKAPAISDLAVILLKRIGQIDPPGCMSEVVDHPNPACRNERSIEVGFVLEHRFAFFYWMRCKENLRRNQSAGQIIEDHEFKAPDLVTWDWHDDVGGECDFDEDELTQINQSNEQEVGLFCWAGLRTLNDGHIAPAMWLNVVGNVYVIQKQHQDCKGQNRTLVDRFGKEHQVYYFRSMKDFPRAFEKTNSDTGVIWDLDLDYFTKGGGGGDTWYTPCISSAEIISLLSANQLWMPLLLRDLKAITIALEPKYTGGLSKSLELYRSWEDALFSAPLFSQRCRWRARKLMCHTIK